MTKPEMKLEAELSLLRVEKVSLLNSKVEAVVQESNFVENNKKYPDTSTLKGNFRIQNSSKLDIFQ